MKNAREVAFDALQKVNLGDGYSNIVLDEMLTKSELSAQDKAFATALFYGVLERKITLDYCIDKFLQKKSKLQNTTREILRIGAYQILFMDRVPDSAAVNEAVEGIRKTKDVRSAGLVNAILRKISNGKFDLLYIQGDSPEITSVKYSIPLWFVHNMSADYSKETANAFFEASLEVPPVYIRVNTLKTEKQAVKDAFEAQDTVLPYALKASKIGAIGTNPLFVKGDFFVEDLASQICVNELGARPNERVLDICAAPGGKSFSIALGMENKGEIVACDLHAHRCELIKDGAKRLGIDIIKTMQNDGTKDLPSGEFDRILCDVPCSGFGIIRRKPDIKYKNPDELKSLPPLQLSILSNASKAVKKGGTLVYSTCTLRKSENEKVADRFLKANVDFKLEKMQTLMPQDGDTDGFFIAKFIKKGAK